MPRVLKVIGFFLFVFLGGPYSGRAELSADVVIGQPDMEHNSGSSSLRGLGNPESLDRKGDKLFIADAGNQRVLIFNTVPTGNYAEASVSISTPSITGYCRGVSCDGLRLYVNYAVHNSTDSQILRYNQIPTVPGTYAADQVLKTFTYSRSVFCDGSRFYTFGATTGVFIYDADTLSYVMPCALSSFPGPATCNNSEEVAGDGSRLFLADRGFNRVLIWNTIPTGENTPADVVVGQPDMGSSQANQGDACAANTLSNPRGMFSDGYKLFIADSGNNRVLIYDTLPSGHNASASRVLGQPDMFQNQPNQGGPVQAWTLSNPARVCYDGRRLFVSDSGNNRILIYYLGDPPVPTLTPAMSHTLSATTSAIWTPSPTGTPALSSSPTLTPMHTTSETPTVVPTPRMTVTITSSITVSPTLPSCTRTPGRRSDPRGRDFWAYPNPARQRINFVFNLERTADVRVNLFSLSGERVGTFMARLSAGDGQIAVWDCANMSPGLYLAEMSVDGTANGKIKLAIVK